MTFAAGATTAVSASPRMIERVVSPGGIEAWLVEEHAVPLIAMEIAFVGGAAQDPAGKHGAGYLLASLLDEGAGPYDADAFQEKLAEKAIELHFTADRDAWRGSLKTLARHADEAFALLRLALCEPRLDTAAVERVRAQVLAGLRHEAKDPDTLANRAFFAAAFPNHPYGHPIRGTLDSVEAVGRADLDDLRRRGLARSNLVVSVVGAIDAATLARHLDAVFGALPATADLVEVPEIAPDGLGSRTVVDVDVPQSVIRFGGPGIARRDPDFMPAFVLNHILGGGAFTSRLFQEVREKRGLAYGVSTGLMPLRRAAMFTGGTATKNERAAESLAVIREEIGKLLAEGPSADELAKAKQYLIGSYALNFDTSTKIASQLVQIALEGLGIDYIDRRNDLVAAVTAEDLRRAAQRLYGAGELLVVVAGRPVGL
ncbi:pitrilysin family protein [Chelatococcus sp. SYSU_G07232]|uniref:Pitrilysin family protein n=1 Tax=Chelatococcus albus TaxID=3047466 RepID=A0ABT7AET0_9HYPH|nr:pitrilysin family protein [Chelatococcus sp. SYSU_G07232]MDJ1157879.1 pitrilysin family protein [Chelatococcus sp. SYSU_G07232]